MATGISACQRVDDLDGVLSGVGEAQVRIEQHETDPTEASHFEEGDPQGTATQRREGDHALSRAKKDVLPQRFGGALDSDETVILRYSISLL